MDEKIGALEKFPSATVSIVALNVLIFAASIFFGLDRAIGIFGFNPLKLNPFTFLTYMFFHSNLVELLLNCWFILVFGIKLEEKIGKRKFVEAYLFSGIMAVLIHFVLNLKSGVFAVGMSGAASGLLGVCLALLFYNEFDQYCNLFGKLKKPQISLKTTKVILLFFGIQLAYDFLGIFFPKLYSLSFFGQLVGFSVGIIFLLFSIKKFNLGISAAGSDFSPVRGIGDITDNPEILFREYAIKKHGFAKIKILELSKAEKMQYATIEIDGKKFSFCMDLKNNSIEEMGEIPKNAENSNSTEKKEPSNAIIKEREIREKLAREIRKNETEMSKQSASKKENVQEQNAAEGQKPSTENTAMPPKIEEQKFSIENKIAPTDHQLAAPQQTNEKLLASKEKPKDSTDSKTA